MMKKMRWMTDDERWELDMSTPVTLDGVAKAVAGDPLPLSLSRGTRLSRSKQLHFMQRFMFAPFIPCYSQFNNHGGFSLQRVFSFPFTQHLFASLMGQFNLQKFVSSIKENGFKLSSSSSWIGKQLRDKSFYGLGFCLELLLTPDDTLLLSIEASGDDMKPRKKAVFRHEFTRHNLTAEAVWPGLFIDSSGTFWDVPLSMAIDLASVASSDSGTSYHLSMNHNSHSPKPFEGEESRHPPSVPATLLPGFCMKSAFSFKKNLNIWTSDAHKLKMVQPYDIFLSSPHVSLSGIIGAVITASLGDNYVRSHVENESQGFSRGLCFHDDATKTAFLADVFASASCTAQYGNFQRPVMDLTRLYARLDFPSCSKFVSGSTRVARDLYNSQQPSMEAITAMCPNATVSLQQQIVGPFSFRAESRIGVNIKSRDDWHINMDQPVFAVEYALHVLGSAKAVAWYSPMQKEFMVELRFFET